MSDETNAERQRRFKERKLAEGLVLLKLWLKPERAEEIRKAVNANEPVSTNGIVRANGGVSANEEKIKVLEERVAQLTTLYRDASAARTEATYRARQARSAKGGLSEREWSLLVKVCREDTGPHATNEDRHRASQLLNDRRALLVVAGKVKKAKS